MSYNYCHGNVFSFSIFTLLFPKYLGTFKALQIVKKLRHPQIFKMRTNTLNIGWSCKPVRLFFRSMTAFLIVFEFLLFRMGIFLISMNHIVYSWILVRTLVVSSYDLLFVKWFFYSGIQEYILHKTSLNNEIRCLKKCSIVPNFFFGTPDSCWDLQSKLLKIWFKQKIYCNKNKLAWLCNVRFRIPLSKWF